MAREHFSGNAARPLTVNQDETLIAASLARERSMGNAQFFEPESSTTVTIHAWAVSFELCQDRKAMLKSISNRSDTIHILTSLDYANEIWERCFMMLLSFCEEKIKM